MPNTPGAPPGRKGPSWPGIIVGAIMIILIAGQAGQVNALLMVAAIAALALYGAFWFVKRLSTFERRRILPRYALALLSGAYIGDPILGNIGAGQDQIQGLFFVLLAVCAFAGGGVLAAYVDLKKMVGSDIETGLQPDGLEPAEREKYYYQDMMNPLTRFVVDTHQAVSIAAFVIGSLVFSALFLRATATIEIGAPFFNTIIVGIGWFVGFSVMEFRNREIRNILESADYETVIEKGELPKTDDEISMKTQVYNLTHTDFPGIVAASKNFHDHEAPGLLRLAEKELDKRNGDLNRSVGVLLLFMVMTGRESEAKAAHGRITSVSDEDLMDCVRVEITTAKQTDNSGLASVTDEERKNLFELIRLERQVKDDLKDFDTMCRYAGEVTKANLPHMDRMAEVARILGFHDIAKSNRVMAAIVRGNMAEARTIYEDKSQSDAQPKTAGGHSSGFDPSAFGRPATPANEPEHENPREDVDELDGADEGQQDEAAYQKIIDDPESPPELRRRALENLIKLQAQRDDD